MAVNIVLISTYELGLQPFGLASPAAWLRKRGHIVVLLDLARQSLDVAAIADAQLIAIYLPMHTATRLAAQLIPQLRKHNPRAHLCCYGLYAPMNAEYLRAFGVSTVLGGEFEEGLMQLAERLASNGEVCPSHRSRGWLPDRWFDGSEPRLQASLPALPNRSRLQGSLSNCRPRHRARRHSPSGGRRGPTHYLRRSGFLQRYSSRDGTRGSISPRVSRRDLRRDHQDRALAQI